VRQSIKKSFERFRGLILEYGVIAIVIHYVIFAVVIVGFWAAIRAGWQPESAGGTAGSWGAAYLMTKLFQPLRIVATLAITPLVARVYERVTGRSARRTSNPEEPVSPAPGGASPKPGGGAKTGSAQS
jgi:hypothetical protein